MHDPQKAVIDAQNLLFKSIIKQMTPAIWNNTSKMQAGIMELVIKSILQIIFYKV